MPTVKVCLWNIQNYGAPNANKWGADSDLRNRFISGFVLANDIDVLLIMEVLSNARESLRDLRRWLTGGLADADADWAVSFCGCCLFRGSSNPPEDETEVGFKTDGRSEGYAVAWRTNRVDRFRLVDALNDISLDLEYSDRNPNPPATSPLNLSTDGRPAGKDPGTDDWGVQGGYLQPEEYPYDEHGVLMDHWPDLLLPPTGAKNPSQLSLDGSRRPAYVVLELTRDAPERSRLCPVAVYHAPSKTAKAEWGAWQSGLARELYVTNSLDDDGEPMPDQFVSTNRNVLGGDFNYSVSKADWPAWYENFVLPLDRWPDGGADCSVAPKPDLSDAERRTTVHLLEDDHTTPIVGNDIAAYLRHKIDLAFFTSTSTGERPNVPQTLLDDDSTGPYANTLVAFGARLRDLAGALGPGMRMNAAGHGPEHQKKVRVKKKRLLKWVPMLSASWGSTFQNWDAMIADLDAGELTSARRAAEFYAIFVSDHLPLVVDVNF